MEKMDGRPGALATPGESMSCLIIDQQDPARSMSYVCDVPIEGASMDAALLYKFFGADRTQLLVNACACKIKKAILALVAQSKRATIALINRSGVIVRSRDMFLHCAASSPAYPSCSTHPYLSMTWLLNLLANGGGAPIVPQVAEMKEMMKSEKSEKSEERELAVDDGKGADKPGSHFVLLADFCYCGKLADMLNAKGSTTRHEVTVQTACSGKQCAHAGSFFPTFVHLNLLTDIERAKLEAEFKASQQGKA